MTRASRGAWHRIWTIARRELGAMFDHPTGYVLLVVFLAINAFLYFREIDMQGVATLRPMLALLPWVFLFFVPAVTMRTLAEDARSGVMEVVLSQPLTELEFVLGKYLGAVLFLWIALALTVCVPLGLTLGADVQWGPVAAQYVGAALLAAGLAAVGVWTSSLVRSQITAFIAAVAVMFVLILVGLDQLLVGLPPTLAAGAARLGVLSHFENIARGVIDARDAVYFLSLIGVFLALAYGAVLRRKLARRGAAARRLRLGVSLLVATVVVIDLLGGYIGGRLDLTPGKAYTLSPATKQIVGHLDDLVTIKVFASSQLPTRVALMQHEMDDLLRDLRSAAHDKIRVERHDPSSDVPARNDAESLGIEPVQFNVVGQSELQVKNGWLGLAIQYGSGTQTIPFVSSTDDLEYQIVSDIRALTQPKKPVVAVMDATATVGQQGSTLGELTEELGKSYSVRNVTATDSTQPAPDVTALVLVGSPPLLTPAAAARYSAFFKRGGSALVLASGMRVNDRYPIASPQVVSWNQVLEPFGVQIKNDMVYDLAANAIVPMSTSGGVEVLQRYPLFVRAHSTGASVVNRDVSDVLLPWTSSIDTTKKAGYTITPLLVSSRASGADTGSATIVPSQSWPQNDLASRLLAVQVAPTETGKGAVARHGRVIVVGNSDFVSDRFAQNAQGNLELALNATDWLAQDESLISIRSKNVAPPPLSFASAAAHDTAEYGNMVALPAIVALLGLGHLLRRRRRSRAAPGRHGAGLVEAAV